jgi:uncharacterized iron-regulated membrane protein
MRPVQPTRDSPLPLANFLPLVRERVPNYPLTRVLYPETPNQPIRFVVYEGTRQESYKASSLFFDPETGELLRADLLRDQLSGDLIVLCFAMLHFGTFGYGALKVIWFIGGLTFPLLAITGVTMYVNRQRVPRATAQAVA